MAVAHDEATMDLIKTRISHSERPLIRLMRTFYKLTMIPTGKEAEEEGGAGGERKREELEIIHMSFILELRQLVKTLKEVKGSRAVLLNHSESRQLQVEKTRLENHALDEKLKINHLESLLDQARRERRNKIQYEEIGKEVRRFSDRFQSADRINGLAREIESLLEEQGFYAERWASRRAQFDTVISKLEVLQESIKEEKADADRKKALNDDESDDGNIGEEGGEGSGVPKSGGGEEAETDERADGRTQRPTETGAREGSQPGRKVGEPSSGLNPQAASFEPPSTSEQQHTGERAEDRMKIDSGSEELSQNPSSGGVTSSSELVLKTDGQPMEIDGFEPSATAGSIEGAAEDGLVFERATMEDGEEIEEAEEGEEMEDQA
ncbi:hypothetical protein PGT21_005057 [Puccinia graminis f. sp. tritici]|uniref:THO complex subunit mft1 n=1 Tax=Puccinia graminis f. sp. tritici TaxID=56615 RepID=A0A5B0MYC4_PUCGR|nr:hypothetical protein PGT21_005057 [Puccinia graminis f. sp. tritici]KAA1081572.1 hypothetical protein PGTUg99_018401 [Puccinia graminis f. sp. tritici]